MGLRVKDRTELPKYTYLATFFPIIIIAALVLVEVLKEV